MKANQLKAFIDEIEQSSDLKQKLDSSQFDLIEVADEAGYKITKNDAKDFLAEIKRASEKDKVNMPPLVILIMTYLHMLFPDYED